MRPHTLRSVVVCHAQGRAPEHVRRKARSKSPTCSRAPTPLNYAIPEAAITAASGMPHVTSQSTYSATSGAGHHRARKSSSEKSSSRPRAAPAARPSPRTSTGIYRCPAVRDDDPRASGLANSNFLSYSPPARPLCRAFLMSSYLSYLLKNLYATTARCVQLTSAKRVPPLRIFPDILPQLKTPTSTIGPSTTLATSRPPHRHPRPRLPTTASTTPNTAITTITPRKTHVPSTPATARSPTPANVAGSTPSTINNPIHTQRLIHRTDIPVPLTYAPHPETSHHSPSPLPNPPASTPSPSPYTSPPASHPSHSPPL